MKKNCRKLKIKKKKRKQNKTKINSNKKPAALLREGTDCMRRDTEGWKASDGGSAQSCSVLAAQGMEFRRSLRKLSGSLISDKSPWNRRQERTISPTRLFVLPQRGICAGPCVSC